MAWIGQTCSGGESGWIDMTFADGIHVGFFSWTGHYLMNEDFAYEGNATHYIHLDV